MKNNHKLHNNVHPCYHFYRNYKSKVRTKETIEASGAYERPQYEPGPSHCKLVHVKIDIKPQTNKQTFI